MIVPSDRRATALLMVLAAFLPACAGRFDKFEIGRPSSPGTLEAAPTALAASPPSFGRYTVCPNEAVTISWDLHPSESHVDCACLNGAPWATARTAPVSCTSDAGCAADERCRDGMCCGRDCLNCGFPGEMCPSAFDARLVTDGGPAIAITTRTGSTVVRPVRDTTYTLVGEEIDRSGRPTGHPLPEQTLAIDVLAPGAVEPYVLGFRWDCPRCSWQPSSLPDREADLVQIAAVRNTGPYSPVTAGLFRPALSPPSDTVGPISVTRVPTEAFNGSFGGAWSLGLTDEIARSQCTADLTGLGTIRCGETAIERFGGRRLPDFTLSVDARCRPAKP